jgi:alpha/beta superfamily hydrolase
MIAETAAALTTADGPSLEARIAVPPGARIGVVVCHPHPLYGGDMHNPVVVRAVEVCADEGLATLRFNFRGVGGSTGAHGNGIAERGDIESALHHLAARLPEPAPLALAGYSFGALVAAHVAASRRGLIGLCLIAPPLRLGDGAIPPALAALAGPLSVVAGTLDEYCPPAALAALTAALPGARLGLIEGANHFFFGKLFPLGEQVASWARAVLGRADGDGT